MRRIALRIRAVCLLASLPACADVFVPLAPCRVMDTRLRFASLPEGLGAPLIPGGSARTIPVTHSACGVPAGASAYSINATVVPRSRLSYLTLWAAGQPQPPVSTLNSFDGEVRANAAIVPVGNQGSINAYATDDTDLIIDINGAFIPQDRVASLARFKMDCQSPNRPHFGVFSPCIQTIEVPGSHFVPITPCRVLDTRLPGPFEYSSRGITHTSWFSVGFPLQNHWRLPVHLPSSVGTSTLYLALTRGRCNIPDGVDAFSLNATAVPSVGYLGYLTLFSGSGQPPTVSTLNSFEGRIVANAALVPGFSGDAGTGISARASEETDLILDVNGYFVPSYSNMPGKLSFHTVQPCRVMDTRPGSGKSGAFGPPMLALESTREIPIRDSGCGIPFTARAYALNVTVIPEGPTMHFLAMWPAGLPRPEVSTLNSFHGKVVNNAAIVPAGNNGAVNVFVTHRTHLIVDISGYFATL